jgi:hypothetical protein
MQMNTIDVTPKSEKLAKTLDVTDVEAKDIDADTKKA